MVAISPSPTEDLTPGAAVAESAPPTRRQSLSKLRRRLSQTFRLSFSGSLADFSHTFTIDERDEEGDGGGGDGAGGGGSVGGSTGDVVQSWSNQGPHRKRSQPVRSASEVGTHFGKGMCTTYLNVKS